VSTKKRPIAADASCARRTPPYDLTAPAGSKARAIGAAVTAATRALDLPVDAIVAVAMPPGREPYNLDALWARIAVRLDGPSWCNSTAFGSANYEKLMPVAHSRHRQSCLYLIGGKGIPALFAVRESLVVQVFGCCARKSPGREDDDDVI
jgi:hypothetical protein